MTSIQIGKMIQHAKLSGLLLAATPGLLPAQVTVSALGPSEVVNHRILYSSAASGRIAAHALPGGQRLWESVQPARLAGVLEGKPVGFTDCRAAERSGWCLAVFDTAKGRQGRILAQSAPLPLPDYVPPFAAGPEWDGRGHTFRGLGTALYFVALGGKQGSFSVAWSASWRYSGGAAPPPSMITQRRGAGVFTVTFPEGAVTVGPDILANSWLARRPDRYDGPLALCQIRTGGKEQVSEWLWRHAVSVSCQPAAEGQPWTIELEPVLIREYPPRP